MKLSKRFLNDYVDVADIPTRELAEKMVFAGNEYESLEPISTAKGLVIGEIVSCEKHPDSKKLSICNVNVGETEPLQILCGAPNVVMARKVIVAKIGAVLPGGEIKKAKLAGMDSYGMICSLAELGLDAKYVTEEDKKGIHILPDDAPVGEDAIHYLGYDDEVIDFELTANRGDLLSVLGMAYEVGALYDRPVIEPVSEYEETGEEIQSQMTLEVQTDHCPIYLGKLVKNVVIKESPNFIKARLMASGIRPINNVVDISNYVMLEFGQPLHFFDYDRLGNHVYVRNAHSKEEMTTLDGQRRVLDKQDIVIANEQEAVCLAGVMGGQNTEVEADTKNIFIEAAIFDPLNIRYTSKRVLRSEASNRYEKGIDPNRTEQAIHRACALLAQYASGEVAKGMLKHDVADHNDSEIIITRSKINNVLGLDIPLDEIEKVLIRLGFSVTVNGEIFHIIVPTRRLDVTIPEDIIEEVGRIYGYEHLEGKVPVGVMKKGSYTKQAQILKDVRNRLSALGLHQVITYSLVSETESKLFPIPDSEEIVLQSPQSEEHKIMRRSLIPSLLNVYRYNMARGIRDLRFYEVGSIYYKKENVYNEKPVVAGLLSGTYLKNSWNGALVPVDFYVLKGVVEQLLHYLGFAGRYRFVADIDLNDMHPGRSGAIMIDRTIVGYLGQVHPGIEKKAVYVFELNLHTILGMKTRGVKFRELNKYPTVKKDVAFIVKKEITSEMIKQVIQKAGGRLLTNIEVFDVYTGDNVGTDEKSVAYSLEFQDMTKTLQDEEVTAVFKAIIGAVTTKLNGQLRDK